MLISQVTKVLSWLGDQRPIIMGASDCLPVIQGGKIIKEPQTAALAHVVVSLDDCLQLTHLTGWCMCNTFQCSFASSYIRTHASNNL